MKHTRRWIGLVGWGVVLACLPLLMSHLPAGRWALHWLASCGATPEGLGVFALGSAIYCALGLPRQALGLLVGATFGLSAGVVLATLAYLGGATLDYGMGRLWQRRFGENRSGTFLAVPCGSSEKASGEKGRDIWAVAQGALQQAPFRTVLTLRLLPVGSALLVSCVSGALRVRFLAFFWASFLGGLPQNVIFVLAGNGMRVDRIGQGVLAASLLLLSGGLGLCGARQVVRVLTGKERTELKNPEAP